MWCSLSSTILADPQLTAQACSANVDSVCIALCPNADFSGVGVRTAFYVQSLMNTLLVIFSRRDSVPSTWAATLLTGSLVIAAMVQKKQQTITLHHAILTLNFATLSCISSLAVAPTLPIWRLTPREYYAKRLAHDILDEDDDGDDHQNRMVGNAVDAIAGRHRKKIERAQSRQRLFLALALLIQVVLQWAWGIVLFVSPSYSQKNCSGGTSLIFFLTQFTAQEINDRFMAIWVAWLLFSLGITLFMTVVLALTSPSRARSWTLRSSSTSSLGVHSTASSSARPVYKHMFRSAVSAIPSWGDRPAQLIFWYNVLCVVLWLIYIISSEIQIQANCVFAGENTIAGFGQITALLLSLAPLWSLVVALYKWPEAQRRLERRRRREQARGTSLGLPPPPPTQTQHSMASQTAPAPIAIAVLPAGPPNSVSDVDAADADAQAGGEPEDRCDRDRRGAAARQAVAAHPARECAVPLWNGVRGAGVRTRVGQRQRQRPPSPDDACLPRTTPEDSWNQLASFPQRAPL